MSFFLEVAKKLGLDKDKLFGGFSMINYNSEAIYIEGILGVLGIETDCISFKLKNGTTSIFGQQLYIFELNETAIVKGQIKKIEFEKYQSEVRKLPKGEKE
ncbi:MAG: YabP/YqfC family sporulation protein [Firmicutes bacterium]|nr:YabP/YqfC family sporulation protein [Bacillota bacterium]